jgi:competence protein ComEA
MSFSVFARLGRLGALGLVAWMAMGAAGRAAAWGSAKRGEPDPKGGKVFDGVVNLNTAPPALLLMLPGVGPGRVRSILEYRARRPFRTVDELVRVKGIGRRMVREIRGRLAVTGPSTARAGPSGLDALNAIAALPPPVAVRPLCRPTAVPAPVRTGTIKTGAQLARPVASSANHCARPP